MTKKTSSAFNLWTLFLIVFLHLLGVGIVIPILAPLMLDPSNVLIPAAWDEGMRTVVLGVLIAVFPMAQFFGAPIWGSLSDRHGRKKILTLCLFGTFVGYVLFAIGILTNQLWLLFASRILDGFTGGSVSVANSSIADMSTDETSKAKNFGLIGMAFGLGFIIGPFLGGQLSNSEFISWFNYATPFYFTALLSLLSIGLLCWKFEETLHTRLLTRISMLTGFQNLIKAVRLGKIRVTLSMIFFHALGFNFFAHFFPVLLVQKFAYTPADIGLLFGWTGVWIAIGQGGITRWVANYLSARDVLRFAPFFLALSVGLLVVPNIPIWFFVINPLIAIFEGLTFPNTTTLVSELATDDEQGEMMGIQQSLRALSEAIAPVASGLLVIGNPNLPTLIAAGFILLAWAIFVLGFRLKKIEIY